MSADTSFYADMANFVDEAFSAPGAMKVAAGDPNFAHAGQNIQTAIDEWPNVKRDLAALCFGIGSFVLGALMIAFSFGEDLASIAERAVKLLPAAEL